MIAESEKVVDEFRGILDTYAKAITEAGGVVEYFDSGMSMVAEHAGEKVWVCQMFRPDRDGCYGYRLMGRPMVEGWLKRNEKNTGEVLEQEVSDVL